MTTKCRSCGAKIFFVETPAGKKIPLDAAACPDGNLVINAVGHAIAASVGDHGDRYKIHFATCPQARQWRHP